MHSNMKRLMAIEFSRYTLHKIGGFTIEIFKKILDQLPEGTEVRGFAEYPYKDAYGILLSHDSFPEVQEGMIYSIIECIVTKPDIVELKWPDEYKNNHSCQYKIYHGFAISEEICTICGSKK